MRNRVQKENSAERTYLIRQEREARKKVYKRALILAVPMMIQNGITNAVGLVDNVMVGSLGTESMTAVSIAGQLFFVFSLAIFGGMSGPGIYSTQYFGQGNIEGVRNVFRLKWWIGLFCLVAGIVVFVLWGNELLSLYLQGQEDGIDAAKTLQYGREYMLIMLFGLPPFVVTQIYANTLRETGESVKPMIAAICSVVADICFNYLLIYGKLGLPRLEVRGAAVATVIARMVEMCVIVGWAHFGREKYAFLNQVYRSFQVPGEMAVSIIKKSLPIFFNEFLWAGGMAVMTQCYSIRGLTVVAGMTISNALCNMLNVVFIAMGNAVGILSGQMLGASEYEKAKKDSVRLMWFTSAMSLFLSVVLILVAGVFPFAYDTTRTVRHYGTCFIIITALFFPLQGFLNSLYFTLRSGGKTMITFLFDSMYSWVISVPAAFVLCRYTTLPILVVFALVQSLDFIKVVVGYILIKKGVWMNNLVA